MGNAAGDMKQLFCSSFCILRICTFVVCYIRELSSPLLWFYRYLRHHSRGTTMNAFPIPAITAVFVIMFNPITMALPWLPWYYRHPRPHAALFSRSVG